MSHIRIFIAAVAGVLLCGGCAVLDRPGAGGDSAAPDFRNAMYTLTLSDAMADGQSIVLYLCGRDGRFSQAWATVLPLDNIACPADASQLRVRGDTLSGEIAVWADGVQYRYSVSVPARTLSRWPNASTNAIGRFQCAYGMTDRKEVGGPVSGEVRAVADPAGPVTFVLKCGKAIPDGNEWQRRTCMSLTVKDGKVVEGSVYPEAQGNHWSTKTDSIDMRYDGHSLTGAIAVTFNPGLNAGPCTFVLDGTVSAGAASGSFKTMKGGKAVVWDGRFFGVGKAHAPVAADSANVICSLVMSNAVDGEGPMEVHLERRDGRFLQGRAAVMDSWQQVHGATAPDFVMDGARATGEVAVTVNPFGWPGDQRPALCVYAVDAECVSNVVKGTYKGRYLPRQKSGNYTGTVEPWGEWRSRNAIAGGKGYPRWRGADGNGSAPLSGGKLVDDLARARLVWRSEEKIPDAWVWSNPRSAKISGGYASPVVADGRVYVAYYETAGPDCDEGLFKQNGYRSRNKWLLDADDVALCADAVTGATLWKKVFKGRGCNWNAGLAGPFMTPCVAGDKVVFVGSSGLVYCMDARNGRLRWETPVGPDTERVRKMKDEALKNKKLTRLDLDFCGSPLIVDGVVVCNDNQGGLVGLSVDSGSRIWGPVTNCIRKSSSPSLWQRDGKKYVLSMHNRFVCVDPATGRLMWEFSEGVGNQGTLAISGDYVVTGDGSGKFGGLNCFRVGIEGATRLWSLGGAFGLHVTSPVIHGGYVYGWRGGPAVCVELETGKVLGEAPFWSVRGCSSYVAMDGRIVRPHLYDWLLLYDADPKNFKQLGAMWKPASYAECTTPAVVDGRLFFRGKDCLYCYDLREGVARVPATGPRPVKEEPPAVCE